jgi:hypothetical protein
MDVDGKTVATTKATAALAISGERPGGVFELLLGLGEQRGGGRERTLRVGADG